MDSHTSEPTTEYKSVTVDVPADRLAEFHAFFARFLAGRSGRGRRGRSGGRPHRGPHHHRGMHGRRCGQHGESAEERAAVEPREATGQSAESTMV